MITIQLPGALMAFCKKCKTVFLQLLIETLIYQDETFREDSPVPYLFENVVFNWLRVPNFWEGRVENRAKMRKRPNFPGLRKAISPIYP